MQARLVREDFLKEIGADREWDVIVIGGGATGLGTAVDALSRGYRTLLLEAEDFAKATSSRSTKLVHGGVRYLQQGNIKLVLEALGERGRMLRNAPHLAHRRSFIIPAFSYWQLPFYGAGLTAYDLLAGRESIGHSRILSARRTVESLPTICRRGLKGGILYYDGQFDDARYAIALLRTLAGLGGTALNYARVTRLSKQNGIISGVHATDVESGQSFHSRAKVVINATGIFSDQIRAMDDPVAPPILSVSQGSHFVLPRDFLPADSALMIPRTSDGRVLFAIPWHDSVVAGTTDDPVPAPAYEPEAMQNEQNFLVQHIERYLGRRPTETEVKSMWSGQRPLVRQTGAGNTASLSRDHAILVSPARLFTITGGKWTTYRKMAEDVMDRAAQACGLPLRISKTADLRLHGWSRDVQGGTEWHSVYGADLVHLRALASGEPPLGRPLIEGMPFWKAEAVWAVRYEMARTVEDVLARRTRALFLNARAALACAPEAARLIAPELGRDEAWQRSQIAAFSAVAEKYIWKG